MSATSQDKRAPLATPIKVLGLCLLCGGFAVEITALLADSFPLFKGGLFAFLMAPPLYLTGWLLGRRR